MTGRDIWEVVLCDQQLLDMKPTLGPEAAGQEQDRIVLPGVGERIVGEA